MKNTCMIPAAFNALPRNEKAILIAQDVIQQIKLKHIIVSRGSYIKGDFNPAGLTNVESISTASEEGKSIIAKSKCLVCAKGAIFLSSVQKSNKMSLLDVANIIKIGTNYENYDNPGLVSRRALANKVCSKDNVFTSENFDLIESAFERDPDFYDKQMYKRIKNLYRDDTSAYSLKHKDTDPAKVKTAKSAVIFGNRYINTDVRLVAICMNIIKNNGVFDPTKNIPKLSDVLRKLNGRRGN